MKRIVSALFTLALCLSMAFAPMAYAAQTPYVIDQRGVLDSSQAAQLESQAEAMASKYNIGVYLLLVDDVGSKSARNYAKDYYKSNDLGVGSLKAGILFLIAVDSRDYVTVTYGDAGGKTIPDAGGVDAFTDARIQNMESDIIKYLKNNDWSGAAKVYYSDAEETLAYLAEHGEPMNNYRLNHDNDSGSDEESDGLFGKVVGLLAAIGLPGIAAAAKVSGQKKAMQTAREASEAGDYLQRGSLTLVESDDQFVNTTVTVAPIPKHDDDDKGSFGGGFGGFGSSSIDFDGFGGSSGGKF